MTSSKKVCDLRTSFCKLSENNTMSFKLNKKTHRAIVPPLVLSGWCAGYYWMPATALLLCGYMMLVVPLGVLFISVMQMSAYRLDILQILGKGKAMPAEVRHTHTEAMNLAMAGLKTRSTLALVK